MSKWMLFMAFLCLGAFGGQTHKSIMMQLQQQKEAEGWTFELSEEGLKYATGLKPLMGGAIKQKKDNRFHAEEINLPAHFHLKEHLSLTNAKSLTPIFDQGDCGSCVYNSVVKNIGDSLLIRNVRAAFPLSRQEAMGCGHQGQCNGAYFAGVAADIKANRGLHTESAYPYQARNSSCKTVPGIKYGAIRSYTLINTSHKSIFTALYQGYPVSVTVGADNPFMAYSGGIYNACTSTMTNHEVLIYGWDCGTSVDKDGNCLFDANGYLPAGVGYGILVNSWGKGWGENGEMRIQLSPKRNPKARCNNFLEEAGIVETGIPMPEPGWEPVPDDWFKPVEEAALGIGAVILGILTMRKARKKLKKKK